MYLRELLTGVKITGIQVPQGYSDADGIMQELQVLGIASDSKNVRPGDVFICIKGEHTDGHLYAPEAVRNGAAAVVAMKPMPLGVPVITVENTRRAAAFMWNNRYMSPAADMTVIAVTGTNGKTSVTYMLREILQCAGYRCGLMGTVTCMAGDEVLFFGGGSEKSDAAAAMTTPDPEFLYGMLYEMRQRGVTHVVMEASSHALSQHKLDPISADIAVFTGLSCEHLDYHGTMDNYLSAKAVLFRTVRRSIINADDSYAEKLCSLVPGEYIRVGAKDGGEYDYAARNTARRPGEVMYDLTGKGMSDIIIRCPMPGRFGVYNSLLAAAAAMELGIDGETVSLALGKFGGVPGRMETVATLGKLRVIRDFAHTPEAMRGALQIASEEKQGKLWLLFGCGGDRDRTKRPEMGRIASEMADFTVITSDNCRSEPRDAIIADIMKGFDKAKPHAVIPDREAAIRYAIGMAGERDTVLLLGKGHENYEIDADGMRPFDEAAISVSAIEERRLRCSGSGG